MASISSLQFDVKHNPLGTHTNLNNLVVMFSSTLIDFTYVNHFMWQEDDGESLAVPNPLRSIYLHLENEGPMTLPALAKCTNLQSATIIWPSPDVLRDNSLPLFENLPPQLHQLTIMLETDFALEPFDSDDDSREEDSDADVDERRDYVECLAKCPWNGLAAALEHCVGLKKVQFQVATLTDELGDVKDFEEAVLSQLPHRLRSLSTFEVGVAWHI